MLVDFQIKNQCQNDRKKTNEQNKNYKINVAKLRNINIEKQFEN
jgi:hypothetical protein